MWFKLSIPLNFLILLAFYPSLCMPMRTVPRLVPQMFGRITIVGFASHGW